ncbi:MAG: CAP domain-containing protein [Phycisphaerae bacterium]|nr:CAP domain-containing protein [Phycisphaerae bacterium]
MLTSGTIRWAFGCLLLLTATGCFPPDQAGIEPDTSASRCVEPEDEDVLADQVLQLVNLERAGAGKSPVVFDPVLTDVADVYACRMADEGFFGHYDPVTGHGPADRAVAGKYRFYSVGENLAAGQRTPAEVVRVWMESPAHRDVILDNRWQDVGVAVRYGGQHGIYWVLEFGEPLE